VAYSPLKVLLDDVRAWGSAQGLQSFHLGGGVGAREDSLFQFKRRFSPLVHEFRIGSWILKPTEYRDLENKWRKFYTERGIAVENPEFFPIYRHRPGPPTNAALAQTIGSRLSRKPQKDESQEARPTRRVPLPQGAAMSKDMNVLLTCAGRTLSLVHFFQEALGRRGRAIPCDVSGIAPALAAAEHKVVVPPLDSPEYYDVLLSICREQGVRLIVSVNDLELGGLAWNAPRFLEEGTIPVVASPEVIATCHDKWAAFRWLRTCGIPTPETYLTLADARLAISNGTLHFPLLVKPRWGSRSIGIELVESERELELALEWGKIQIRRTILAKLNQQDPAHAFIIQEHIDGQEYGIDVVNDLNGNHVATFARRKLAMRGGSTDRAISVAEPRLERLGKSLGERLTHLGNCDCDVMATDRGCFVVDMNPRFGGGYPFSHLAGANLPAALIAWAGGTDPDPKWLQCQPGVLSSRYEGVMVVEREVPANTPGKYASMQQSEAPIPISEHREVHSGLDG
jgi:carbamoyl-phosphate synthase large subunit